MNKDVGGLVVTTPTDREIAMIRSFNAPRTLVFEALTKPELVRQWLLGPDGWTMVVCTIDLRVGGAYRYQWKHAEGHEMGMGGQYLEIERPERLVTTEKFDESWYPGSAVGTLVLEEVAGRTTLTLTVRYDNREARDAVLKTPMEDGVAAGYNRLEKLLAG